MHLILIALMFNGIDLLSGIVGAVKTKSLQSDRLRNGLFKKCGFFGCYGLAFLIDRFGGDIGIELGFEILPVVIAYTVITEVSSIIENLTVINPELRDSKIATLFNLERTDKNEGSSKGK